MQDLDSPVNIAPVGINPSSPQPPKHNREDLKEAGPDEEDSPPPHPRQEEAEAPTGMTLKDLVQHRRFKSFILWSIVLNFILVVIVQEVPTIESIYAKIDVVFLAIFSVEAILKMGAYGISGYFKKPSYVLDFILLAIEAIECAWSLIKDSKKVGPVGFLRLGRPLRILYKFQHINGILKSVVRSLPTMGGIFLIFFALLCFCAGVMTQILMGDLGKECFQGRVLPRFMSVNGNDVRYRCQNDETCFNLAERLGFERGPFRCLEAETNPANGTNSFDNFFDSLLNLFMIITLDNWSFRMVEVRQAEGHVYFDVLFIVAIVGFSLAMLNTVVAVQIQFMEEEFFKPQFDEKKAAYLAQLVSKRINTNDFVHIRPVEAVAAAIKQNQEREAKCGTWIREKWAEVSTATRKICDHLYFDRVIIAIIIAYLILVIWFEDNDRVEYYDWAFLGITAAEVILKLISYGTKYFFNIFNWIDFGVCILSLVEIFNILEIEDLNPAYGRLLRILRVVQTFKEWESARIIFMSLIDSVKLIINFSFLIVIYLYFMAALGNAFFADVEFPPDALGPRPYGFQSIHQGVMTGLILLTSSNWTIVAGEVIKAKSRWASLYFVAHMLMGHLMLLNIYVAILVKVNQAESLFEEFVKKHDQKQKLEAQARESRASGGAGQNAGAIGGAGGDRPQGQELVVIAGASPPVPANRSRPEQIESNIMDPNSDETCMKTLRRANDLAKKVLSSAFFENFILCVLILNSLLLQIDDELHDQVFEKDVIVDVSRCVAQIFAVEWIIKVMVYRSEYLSSKWNWLDTAVAILSLPEIFPGVEEYMQTHPSTKILRSFRVLRIGNSSEGIRTVMKSLLRALPSLGHVLFVYTIIITVFGIIGKVAFSDVVYSVHSFDTFWNSVRAFFDISTLNNWELLMEKAAESTSTPFAYTVFVTYIFFVTFYILKLFVSTVMDAFNSEMRKEIGIDDLNSRDSQWILMVKQLTLVEPIIIKHRPVKDKQPYFVWRVRCFLFDIVTSDKFDYGLSAMIFLNTLCEMFDHANQTEGYKAFFKYERLFFKHAFTVEMAVKFIALGPTQFSGSSSNKFDMVLLLSKWYCDLGPAINVYQIDPTVLRFLRLTRLARKYFKTFPVISSLVDTISIAASNLIYTCFVLMGTIFIFTILAINLFHDIELAEFGNPNYIYMVNEEFNFNSFYRAYVTLFRIATVDSWIFIAHQIGFIGNLFFVSYIVVVFLILENLFIAVVWEVYIEVRKHNQNFEDLRVNQLDIQVFREAWSEFDPIGDLRFETSQLRAFFFRLANVYKSEVYIGKVALPWYLEGINLSMKRQEEIEEFKQITFDRIKAFKIRDHHGEVYFPELLYTLFYQAEFGGGEEDRMVDESLWRSQPIKQSMQAVRRKYSGFRKTLTLKELCSVEVYLSDKLAYEILEEVERGDQRIETLPDQPNQQEHSNHEYEEENP